ncbi:unnamed protein product [Caenorhabditis sp. 36 PRJEB53466]|nr:unnamed protein product [Caenorhabditis sp. 36 PRJEB53466]
MLIDEAMEATNESMENDVAVLEDAVAEQEELETMLKKSSGPTRKPLEAVFRAIDCDSRIWFQELDGNQVRKLHRSPSIVQVLDVFPHSFEVDVMSQVMLSLDFMVSNAANKVKADEEIDEIEKVVEELVRNLRIIQPDATPTPKLHMLVSFTLHHEGTRAPLSNDHSSMMRYNSS